MCAEKIYDIYLEFSVMELWKKLLLVAVIVAAVIAAYLFWPRPQSKPELIVLTLHIEGKGSIDYNGKLRDYKPFNITLTAKPEEYWLFRYWILNGTEVIEDEELYLEVRANSTLKAVFEELPKYKLTVFLRGNGTCTLGNSTWYTRTKIEINCTPAQGWILANATLDGKSVELPVELIMDKAHSLEVFFEKIVKKEVRGKYTLRIVSNADNAIAIVNHTSYPLPYTIAVNETTLITVEGLWKLPYNGTHAWWLGWYNLTGATENETISEIFPYYKFNKTILVLNGNYTIELHYVRGLKNLPYVLKAWTLRELSPDLTKIFPKFGEKIWDCDVSIEEGYIRFYNFHKYSGWRSRFYILLEFDDGVNNATIMVWDNWPFVVKSDVYGDVVIPMRLEGQLFLELCGYDFMAYSGEKYVFSAWLEPYSGVYVTTDEHGREIVRNLTYVPVVVGLPRILECSGIPDIPYPEHGEICSCPSLKGRLGTPWNVTILPNTGHYAVYLAISFPVVDPSYEVYVRVLGVEP
ncbi:MAG: hypothetical protein DRJ38_08470 [Thermoprotei archaeon]|nr:MAG: hypothetical protein DRJ38_08470 [Thermoprotei archaeon]